jgi:drug/metabolite transporter (DMT)-like permease
MLYLVVTIILNAFVFTIFKIFPKYHVNSLQAIVFNYFTCVITGSIFLHEFPSFSQSVQQPWFPWSILMGVMFITLFNLISWRTHVDGLTTTTVANKLSLIIPVLFSVFLYSENLNGGKIAGILLAFPAVYLTSRVHEPHKKPKTFLYPALLFIGSGLLDTFVKYIEQKYMATSQQLSEYTIYVFCTSSIVGAGLLITLSLMNKIHFRWRNVLAGIILGIPNYFSIYFLIKLLHSDFLHSSAAIPVNNIGILILCSLVAIIAFKELISWQRILGLILSVVAILLIALSDLNG